MGTHHLIEHPQALVPSNSIVTDPVERKHYISKIQQLWGLPPHINHFAGSNPVSIERKDLPKLKQAGGCTVSLKTDGIRYILLLTTSPEGEGVAIMINRSMIMYEVEVWSQLDFFIEGSLFDGELVWEYVNYVPKMRYVVFDVMHCCGQRCVNMRYPERIQLVTTVCVMSVSTTDEHDIEQYVTEEKKIVAMNNAYDLQIVPKRCAPSHSVTDIWGSRHESPHKNDGLIFIIDDAPIEINTSSSTFKWKSDHTIDVLVKKKEDAVEVFYMRNSRLEKFTEIVVERTRYFVTISTNELLESVETGTKGSVLECSCSVMEDRITLFALKVRFDKDTPNNMRTVQRTVVNIIENITVDELAQAVRQTP